MNDFDLTDDKIIELYKSHERASLLVSRQAVSCEFGEWIKKQLSIYNTVTVYNKSGKTAWICVSPKQVPKISKVEINRLGALEFNAEIESVVQKYMLIPNAEKQFTLDNPILYYTIIFSVDGTPFIFCENIQLDSRLYDLNITYKHSASAIIGGRMAANLR